MENEVTVALSAHQDEGQVESITSSSSATSVMSNNHNASLIAGYVAGSAGLLIGHPMDSLKVLIQTQGSSQGPSPSAATTAAAPRGAGPTGANTKAIASSLGSMAQSASSAQQQQQQTRGKTMAAFRFPMPPQQAATNTITITNKRSLLSLYAGIGTPLMSIGLVQSLNFFMYDSLRRHLYYYHHQEDSNNSNNTTNTGLEYLHQDSIANVAQAAFVSGAFMSLVTSPLQVLKTTQQLHPRLSMRGALQHITSGSGGGGTSSITSLFRGYVPHLVCETFGRGVYFGTYELLKRYMIMSNRNRSRNKDDDDNDSNEGSLSMAQRMGAASVAGMASWSIIYPWDVIRCRMYALQASAGTASANANTIHKSHLSMTRVISQMYQSSGTTTSGGGTTNKLSSFRPFFRGFGITVLRAGPVAAVVLPVYDVTLEWLNNNHQNQR
jgi:hypothetical protein